MSNKKLAEVLFDCQVRETSAKCEIEENLAVLGVKEEDGLEGWFVDYYDRSIEFRPENPAFQLSKEMKDYLSDVGFHLCWIQYPDGTTKAIGLLP